MSKKEIEKNLRTCSDYLLSKNMFFDTMILMITMILYPNTISNDMKYEKDYIKNSR